MKVKKANVFKKFFAVVLSLLIVTGSISLTAFAAETSGIIEETNLTWSFSESTGELCISGNGEMKDFADISLIPWYEFRTRITSAVIEDGVTNIVKNAFYYCNNLTAVVIGKDVEAIAADAFAGCASLVSVTIPENVQTIAGNPFSVCTSLKEISVDENNGNFCAVEGVLFSIDKTVLITYPIAKENTYYRVPKTVTKIADSAFRANNLTSVDLLDALVSIGSYAFANSNNIKQICFPGTLQNIGAYAFTQSNNLEIAEFPESIKYIGSRAFYGCDKLSEIFIPDVLVNIGGLAFENTAYFNNAERVDGALYIDNHLIDATDVEGNFIVREGTITIASQAFWGVNDRIEAVWIGDSVKVISGKAFWGSKLRSVIIEGAVDIGSHAFWGCDNLETVYMNEGVEELGEFMFHGCDSLKYVYIPSTVTEISRGAFLGCDSLESLTFYNTVKFIDFWGSLPDAPLDIYYVGTESEFGEIVINEYTKEFIENSTIHYLDENHSHRFNTVLYEIEPTCTHFGCDILACSCGMQTIGNRIYALSHDFGDWFVTKPATETENGIETRYCSRCDETETREISIAVHVHSYEKVVTPSTCTESGFTTYTCSCGDTYKADPTAVLGHLYGDWVVTKEPTATEYGKKVKTCKRCSYEISRSIAPTGEETHEHNYEVSVIHQEETCTTDGIYTYKCTVCGDTYMDTVKTKGHLFGEWKVITEPTWTTKGIKQRECSRCPTIETEEIDVHSTHVFNLKHEVVEPTCDEDGYTIHYCACGATYVDTYVPALGHSYSKWEIIKEATQTEEGSKKRVCGVCSHEEIISIDKLPIEGEATLKVGNVKGRAGETVEVSVRIDGNPGIVATHIMLDYDKEILTLKEVRDGEIFGTGKMTAGNDLTAIPYNVVFVDALAEENYASDGTLVTFVFEISADVPDSYTEVRIDYYAESTFNAELDAVAFTLINGKVEIVNRIAGDANNDGIVNLKDVVIIERFLAGGWGVTLDESASDVNADGMVSLIDAVLINRYLADWDVILE